jgi:hypothetical protein
MNQPAAGLKGVAAKGRKVWASNLTDRGACALSLWVGCSFTANGLAPALWSQRRGLSNLTPPALTKVDPVVVVEVSADAALQAGQWRHPLRMVRIRAEMQPEDVATLPDPAVDA